MKISVVIPVFNEEDSIKELYGQISTALKNQKKYEIIFINDGSSDKSEKAIIDLSNEDKSVKLISFYRNFGKSAA
ncbi:MAG: glycosyltransferase, partial [Candidatus Marinimicrobia bacterium]|nr:glycosyltransferase [Candidatus Neomarinimicrobiota bacterium]